MSEDTKGLDVSAIVPVTDDIAEVNKLLGEIGPPQRPRLDADGEADLPEADVELPAGATALPAVVAAPARASSRRKKITTLHLTSYTCRWPIGDPVRADFHYCGELPAPGRNYCEKHDAMSMQPAARRRAPASS